MLEYQKSHSFKQSLKKYAQSDKGKQAHKRYAQSDKGKEVRARAMRKWRAKKRGIILTTASSPTI